MTNKFSPFDYEGTLQKVIDYFGFLPKWFPNITPENQEHFLKSFYILQFLHNFAIENYGDYNVVLIGGAAMQIQIPEFLNMRFSKDIDLSVINHSTLSFDFKILNEGLQYLLSQNPEWYINFKNENNSNNEKPLWRWEVRAGLPNSRTFKSPIIKIECSKTPTLGDNKAIDNKKDCLKTINKRNLILNKLYTSAVRGAERDFLDILFFFKAFPNFEELITKQDKGIINTFVNIVLSECAEFQEWETTKKEIIDLQNKLKTKFIVQKLKK